MKTTPIADETASSFDRRDILPPIFTPGYLLVDIFMVIP
jgi:hypothetical protein